MGRQPYEVACVVELGNSLLLDQNVDTRRDRAATTQTLQASQSPVRSTAFAELSGASMVTVPRIPLNVMTS